MRPAAMKTVLELLGIKRGQLAPLLILSVTSGLANTGLLYLLGHSISTNTHWLTAIAAFSIVLIVYVVSQHMLLKQLVDQSEFALLNIRMSLSRLLLAVRYSTFEKLGRAEVLSVLTHDAVVLSQFWPLLISLCVSLITIASSLAYLAYLSPAAFGLTAITIVIGVFVYTVVAQDARKRLEAARANNEQFLRLVEDLTRGMKELKLSRQRRDSLLADDLLATCEAHYRNSFAAKLAYHDAGLMGNTIFFALIAFVAYAVPQMAVLTGTAHMTYLVVLLYLAAPLGRIVSNLPPIGNAFVAAARIQQLTGRLSSRRELIYPESEPETTSRPFSDEPWQEMRLVNIEYLHSKADGEDCFVLGPLSLTIERGTVVFLVGGNGAGKSTFGRVLTGLYEPTRGQIYVGDTRITSCNVAAYREMFGAVFSDYHLFTRLGMTRNPLTDPLLRQFALDADLLADEDGSRITTLSQGKKKRVALMLARLEDRSVYFLDEWAAEQDPEFRERFYTVVLPTMRAQGKTIIVATHDDRYFHTADCVVFLDRGKLSATKETPPATWAGIHDDRSDESSQTL